MSLTSAEESRYATAELLAVTVTVRRWLALGGKRGTRRGTRSEIERLELQQIALRLLNGQLRERPMRGCWLGAVDGHGLSMARRGRSLNALPANSASNASSPSQSSVRRRLSNQRASPP